MFYSAVKMISPGLVGGMLCRAWVNFDGTGTVAIRTSANVSSITDDGLGQYVINFTTAMPDSNYCTVAMGSRESGQSAPRIISYLGGDTKTASAIKLRNQAASDNTKQDNSLNNVAIFR